VINRRLQTLIPRVGRAPALAAAVAPFLLAFGASSVHAEPPDGEVLAAIVPQAGGSTPGDASTVVSATRGEKPSDFGGAATLETSIGIGTFAPAPHDNALVSTTLLASAFYRVSDEIRLTVAGSVTWFNVNDFYTALPDNEAMLSDISVGISHSSIYRHADSGFNLSGSFRLLLPTSPGSQFQNRWFTLMPGLSASIPVGDFSFSWGFGFGKFFAGSSVPTVDCSDFPNPEECIQGRQQNSALGFETERRGGEVWIPGQGMNSFFFSNSLTVSWAPVDRLTLALTFGIFNYFGLRSLPVDDNSSQYATAGRNHRDRLISSFAVSYQVLKQLSISTNLVTDSSQPFGARGDDFPVLFDFSRAPTNNTSISLAVTGTF
jgi:hypothetical protein